MNFKGFYGNERAKAYLASAFARKTLPHALLLTGARGIGKKTLANILARAIVCPGEDVPCGICDACHKAGKGFHPDIIRIDAENLRSDAEKYGIFPKKDGNIAVIRELKTNALLRPNDGDRKVYVIENAGVLSHECQDALLKILEEPPLFTFFIITCYNPSDLLPTVISRMVHLALSPLSDSDMHTLLREKFPDMTEEGINEQIKLSGGICSFLVEEENNEFSDLAANIANALISCDELKLFLAVSALEKRDRDSLFSVLDELIFIIRDACVIALDAQSTLISRADSSIAERFASVFSTKLCYEIINRLTEAKISCVQNIGVSHITGDLVCKLADITSNAALKG